MGRAFNGTSGSVVTTLTAHATQRTYAVKLLRAGAHEANLGRIFDKRQAGVQREALYEDPTLPRIYFERSFTTTGGQWGTPGLAASTMTDFAMSYDSSAAANDPVMYVDGSSVTVTRFIAPVGTAQTNTDAYVLGNRGDDTRTWNGTIAEWAVWDAILTADEVAALAKGVPALLIRPQSLVSYIPLDGVHSPEPDLKGGPATVATAAAAAHPRILGRAGRPLALMAPSGATQQVAALVVGSSSVVVAPVARRAVAPLIAASSTVAVAPVARRVVAPAIAAASTVTIAPVRVGATRQAAVAVGSLATVSISPVATRRPAVAIAAQSTTAIAPVARRAASPAIAAQSTVTVALTATRIAAPNIAGQSTVTIAAGARRPAAATVTSTSTVTFGVAATRRPVLAVAATSGVAIAVGARRPASVAVAAQSVVSIAPRVAANTVSVAPQVVAASTVAISPIARRAARPAVAATSSATIAPVARRAAAAAVAASSECTITPVARRVTVITATGVSTVSIAAGAIRRVEVSVAAQSSVLISPTQPVFVTGAFDAPHPELVHLRGSPRVAVMSGSPSLEGID